MARILILAKSNREAGSYAALAGIPTREFRAVNKAAAITGIRNAEVHVLPSFLGRSDRHAILAKLRYARVEVFYVDPADLEEIVEETEPELEETSPEPEKPAPKPRAKPAAKPAPAANANYFG